MKKHTVLEKIRDCALNEASASRMMLSDLSKSFTYSEGWKYITNGAARLQQMKLPGKSPILIHCSQDSLFILNCLAVQLAGLISVPTEKGASRSRILEIAEDTKAPLFIAPEEVFPIFPPIPSLKSSSILDCPGSAPAAGVTELPKPGDVCEILFSTGTTGKSKGIVITHDNNRAIAENIINGVGMKPGNIEIIPMPLSHSHGLRSVYANLYNSSSCVISPGVLMLRQIYDLMDLYGCTSMDLSPSMLSVFFRLSGDRLGSYAEKLDYIQLGSAPLVEEDKTRLCCLLPGVRLYNFYGSTESGRTCALNFNDGVNRPGCIGRPSVNARFIFVDENRSEIVPSPASPGFIATGGAQNMTGYLNAPELTAQAMADGFIYTNDLGYRDDEGFIYCLGRADDVINCAGIKISPEEIERPAMKFEGIEDCACVPVPDRIQGQVPKLFISLKTKGGDFDMAAYRRYLSESLDSSKCPKQVEITDSIPRTSNGKLQRKKLMA